MTVGFWLVVPRLLSWAIILSATLTKAQIVTNFVDTATCYDGLAQADANGDNRVDLDEYLTFVQFLGPPEFLADIDSIANAPLNLRVNFITLSCICRKNGGDAQCCIGDNAHIPIDGINIPDSSQSSFFFLVCSSTNRYINIVLENNPTPISFISPTISLAPSPPAASPEPAQSPSLSPSAIPTTSPRLTTSPSSSPTSSSLSAIPTRTSPHPTTSPSNSPTSSSLSAIPTRTSPHPTTSPSNLPTSIPSAVPSTQPSLMPTVEGIGIVAQTIYTIVIINGITDNVLESSFVPDLIAGMNVVAVEVASKVVVFISDDSRRRLEVRVSLPTFIDSMVDAGGITDTPELVNGVFEIGACPSDLANPNNDKCEQVTASVGLFLDDEAPEVARDLYQAALDRAILQGRLQDALMEINPDSPVRIIMGSTNVVNGSRSTEPESLSADAAAGIVIGALAIGGFMVAMFLVRKRGVKPGFDELQLKQSVSSISSGVEFELDSAAKQELDSAAKQRTDEEAGTVQSWKAVLGATKTDYGQNYGSKLQSLSIEGWSNAGGSQKYIQALSEGGQSSGGLSRASSAGQSGWLSNYTSSIDSAGDSADDLSFSTFGSRMVDMYTVGAIATQLVAKASGRRGSESSWSSRQSSLRTCESSLKVMVDEQKAAELHRLIEGGDWGGVMLAASKFEGDGNYSDRSIFEGDDNCSDGSMSHPDLQRCSTELENAIAEEDWVALGDTVTLLPANASGRMSSEISLSSRQSSILSRQSSIRTCESSLKVMVGEQKAAELHQLIEGGDWEGIILAASMAFESDVSSSVGGSATRLITSSGITPHTLPPSTPSTGTSKNRDRAKVRREVEELVQQVVPEEMESVDTMMMQFKGREDELLATLRAMQKCKSRTRLEVHPTRKEKLEGKQDVREIHQAADIALRPQEEKTD